MKQSRFRKWICCLLLANPLAALADEAQSNSVRVAVPPTLMALPVYVAAERKFFEKNNVKPELIECSSGQNCISAICAGNADIAVSSELPVMFAAYEEKPISLLATLATNKDNLKFLVSRNLFNNGQLNLSGKRIGYVPRTGSHYYMDIFLLFNGVDPQQVVKVPMDATEISQAFLQGEVDAISIWGSLASQAVQLGDGEVVKVEVPRLYTLTFNVSVRNEFKNQNESEIQGVVNALNEAVDYIRKYPSRAKGVALRNNLASKLYIEKNWHEYTFRISLHQSLVSTLKGQARWAQREGHIQSVSMNIPEYLNYIDAMFLRKIKTEEVDFVYR